MNRAERRRQDKRKQASGPSPLALELKRLLDQAVFHHRAGQFAQAEPLYRSILQVEPNHAEALHLLGLLAYQVGKLSQAEELISQAIRSDGSRAPYFFNLGVVQQRGGKLQEAAGAYQQALRLDPRYVEAQCNLGNVWKDLIKLDAAVAAYRKAIAINPQYADAYNNLGVTLEELERYDEAAAAYESALRVNPEHVEAQSNLGNALRELGRLDEAVAAAQRALRLKPDYAKGHYNLAFAYLWQGRLEEAHAEFMRSAELKQNHGRPVGQVQVYQSRVKHDLEQVRYLEARGLMPPGQTEYVQALERAYEDARHAQGALNRVAVSGDTMRALAPSFNRLLYHAAPPRLPQGAVNPELDVAAIEARWHASRPEIIAVDGLLTEEALAALRRFCLEATIWKKDYENGYVGALLGDGFSSPLLLQISEELRLRFPGIFKQHRLRQSWAFKCDSERRGLNMHADAAAVNVNFWITPDEANLDPDHGGLIVWDREAPKEWNFREYNSTAMEPAIREFLRRAGAQPVTVPYRANRALIFNSDLFHETDRIAFKDGYEHRRINITFLYGKRFA